MNGLLRTSIAVRSALAILAIVGLVGLVSLGIAIPLAQQREVENQRSRLVENLDIVQRTVSIACFLSDKQLANEVVTGLLSDTSVSLATIRAGDVLLASGSRLTGTASPLAVPQTLPPDALVRKVMSPFNPKEVVGEIALVPNVADIQRIVWSSSEFIALLLMVEITVAGLGAVAVVIHFVTRPISRISDRLHELHVDAGQKLEIPRGNESDEIGRLVTDVNFMADELVTILNNERALRVQREIEEKKFRTIFEHANTGIFIIDETGMLLSHNPAFTRFFGLADVSSGDKLPAILARVNGGDERGTLALIAQCITEGTSMNWDVKIDARTGSRSRWVNVMLSRIDGTHLEGVVNDVTERKHIEETAQELAATDRLTGLGNRLGFERKLEQFLDECRRAPEHHFALLMVDLDWFKQVNDRYGHKAGDEVLVLVARRLLNAVRKTDFVGRLGGDEFVMLLDSAARRQVIERVVKTIVGSVAQPMTLEGGMSVTVGASVGIAIHDESNLTGNELMRRADEAMYESKQGGRNTYRFFDAASRGKPPAPNLP